MYEAKSHTPVTNLRSHGTTKAAALPGLHAFSGADNTGGFAGKGKPAFWKIFRETWDYKEIFALASLGTMPWPSDAI